MKGLERPVSKDKRGRWTAIGTVAALAVGGLALERSRQSGSDHTTPTPAVESAIGKSGPVESSARSAPIQEKDQIEVSPTPDAEERERDEGKLTPEENSRITAAGFTIKEGMFSGKNGTAAFVEGYDGRKYDLYLDKEKGEDGSTSYVLRELIPGGAIYASRGSNEVGSFDSVDEAMEFSEEIVEMLEKRSKLLDAAVPLGSHERIPDQVKAYNRFIDTEYYPWLDGLGMLHYEKERLYIPE